jgi:predicted ATP-dependent protease
VVLLGDPDLYHLLDAFDRDFPYLFKVLADFDSSLPCEESTVSDYAGVIARIAREEELPPYSGQAIAALAEHGARIAGRSDRLTTRFGRLADIAREGAFIARKAGRELVERAEIEEAVRLTKRRADLPSRRFRRAIREGTIRIATTGAVVGQVNGLAVIHAGPLTYGFPTRITATIGPGTAGTINIEREAELSGSIHTKGFYILGGLLRHLLRTTHPLAFSASIAFEQSYGGIDGDSASAAEMCCLLSALTGVPIRQDRAMTGAIDQHGHIQPIGAANEKIEGFYDVCQELGLTGEQAVIIPRANVIDLMLRIDVVEACRRDQFHILAVDTIEEAIELFCGVPAGVRREDGTYPPGTLLATAVERAHEFWRMAKEGETGK